MPDQSPPVARVAEVRETRFGITTADPYRWMEDESAELREWLAGQAAWAAAALAGLPDRAGLLARIGELTASQARDPAFTPAGDLVFRLRQLPGASVPALLVTDGAATDGAATRVLLDPATLTGPPGAGHASLDWFVPSPDGRQVACGISRGGSELTTLRVVDTGTGALLEEAIGGTFHGIVSWLPDGTAFAYHRYLDPPPGTPPSERRRDSRCCLHRLGDPGDGRADAVILARGRSPLVPMTPVDRPFVFTPAGSDWMIAVISHSALAGTPTQGASDCSLYVAPREGLADPASCPWRKVAGPRDGVTSFAARGADLFLVTCRAAPRSRVVVVSMAEPGLDAATELVPPSERAVFAIRVTGDHLLVHDRDAGLSRLRRVPLAGGPPQEVPLPLAGTIEHWAGDPAGALLTMNSWTQSARLYRYDARTGSVTDTGWLPPSPADFDDITVSDLRVPARDGTLIPLRVVHRRGLARDGDHPAILTGYGSYGFTSHRLFTPELLAWYERGGVHATVALRGGGEFGREWHEAGRGPRKENTITDFIDAAEYLIERGYTSPGRLAGDGVSAGGIPVAGALVRRPELWGAMVLRVAVANLTRTEFSENGPVNVPEFGSVSTPDGLRDLLIIDSYLRVADGVRYPAVLLTAGLNDPRLAVWQPAKMAARLQAATASGRPVLLRVDADAGHGHGSTQAQRNELTADILAFLLNELRGC
jgi:prolyl oligopeptidase